jgi:DNA (cytosine-5)-methyltransferase 1
MKYFSLFTGIGGFELGIQAALPKANCVGYSEIDTYAVQIYQKHFPKHYNYGDITKIKEKRLPDFDLLVGGFPCQSFSIAGHRKGFLDTRGTLFFDIARIIKAKKPGYLLLENVKGLLSHDKGRTFATIISTLTKLGYDLQWQVVNSKDHGVPQARERLIIVGHLRGKRRPEVFPFPENGGVLEQADEAAQTQSQAAIASTIRTKEGTRSDDNFVIVPEATKIGYAIAYEGDSINLSNISSKTRRGRVGKKIAQTLDTGMQQHTLTVGGVRRFTPRECERLQGLPDDWTEGVSDTQRYKTIGNAVTVNVIRDVCARLFK